MAATSRGGGHAHTRRPRSARIPDQDDLSVVRHEEELRVATTTHATREVRLRTKLVTETPTIEVPVRREVLEIEEIALPDGETAPEHRIGRQPGPVTSIVLHEEQPVVTMETVATERVDVYVDVVEALAPVEADLATEHVEVDQIDTSD